MSKLQKPTFSSFVLNRYSPAAQTVWEFCRRFWQSWHDAFQGTGSDDESDSERRRKDSDKGVRKLLLDLSSRIQTDIDIETNEEFDAERMKACLGTMEDRTFLAGMLHRFARDDLKSDGDAVEAAIRMHIHTVPLWKKWVYAILTCGVWVFLRASLQMIGGFCLSNAILG
ncbi:unnamed protein product [Symbiodinium pilosum]|uniref:Uncharacterized protein n=1 Tax=Symbiodinium pilosum TaxID=2952 RepID=A0A812WIL3_SYMPI|nr:unnamed protein product [Symbiodinium pilosum]